QRENGQQLIAAGELIEQAPRRAGVAPMDELEETVDDHLFLRVTEITQHGKLRQLVEHKRCRSHYRHPSGRPQIHVSKATFCPTSNSNASPVRQGYCPPHPFPLPQWGRGWPEVG